MSGGGGPYKREARLVRGRKRIADCGPSGRPVPTDVREWVKKAPSLRELARECVTEGVSAKTPTTAVAVPLPR